MLLQYADDRALFISDKDLMNISQKIPVEVLLTTSFLSTWVIPIYIEYNKTLDRRRSCFEDDLTAGSNL